LTLVVAPGATTSRKNTGVLLNPVPVRWASREHIRPNIDIH
jgi:hypothetical protein